MLLKDNQKGIPNNKKLLVAYQGAFSKTWPEVLHERLTLKKHTHIIENLKSPNNTFAWYLAHDISKYILNLWLTVSHFSYDFLCIIIFQKP